MEAIVETIYEFILLAKGLVFSQALYIRLTDCAPPFNYLTRSIDSPVKYTSKTKLPLFFVSFKEI